MKQKLRHMGNSPIGHNVCYFLKWALISSVTGCLVGLAGAAFGHAINWATGFWRAHAWTLYTAPAAGLVIVWLYRVLKEEKNQGTNMVIAAVSSKDKITLATAPLIFLCTVITHLTSASSGREGAALQLGGSLGDRIGHYMHLDERDKKIAVMCGMSACFASLFGTPVAAGIFSMEVISIGVMYYAALVPCMFSSFIGAAIARWSGLMPEVFPLTQTPPLSLHTAGVVVGLGALCALVSVMFCIVLHRAEHWYHKIFKNPYIRILAGSGIFIALTLLTGNRDYNGGGFSLIERCFETGQVAPWAFLLKMVFTASVICAGFKGGEIVPTLCVGATFGCAFGMITGFSPALSTACGMAALFAGVTNCPVTSILLAFEMFGASGIYYYALVIAVSFTLSGYYSLYYSQKFVYSKTRTEFINRKPTQ